MAATNEVSRSSPDGTLEQNPIPIETPDNDSARTEEDPKPNLLGGTYIPRIRLRLIEQTDHDKTSIAYQRKAWESLKKNINGIVNKANTSNIAYIARDLIRLNLIRGRGLFTKCCIKAQDASQPFTHVFAALIGIVNTKFPQIGELLLKRLISHFKKSFKRNLKATCISSSKFIGHLFNQNIVHEVLILEILTLLLNRPTNDSMEVSIALLKETGVKLTDVCPRGLNSIFDTLRMVLHAGTIDRRIQYAIEVLFAVRKDGFKDFPSVIDELNIVEEEDQFTHTASLDDDCNPETMLDVFRYDADFEKNEEKYARLVDEILGEDEVDESSNEEEEEEEIGAPGNEQDDKVDVIDETETNLVSLRRTIYLTIQSSINFEECAHKLMKINLKPGQQAELCRTILDWCAQQRTYEKFAGLLAHRFCISDPTFAQLYEQIFVEQYEVVHRLETVKLRNIAKFFAHLLSTDGISWIVFQCVRLTEEHTTSSSRVFLKNLLLEMAENLGMQTLNERFHQDDSMIVAFNELFPTDSPQNTRFCINFFTSIGLGGLTEKLREHLKSVASR